MTAAAARGRARVPMPEVEAPRAIRSAARACLARPRPMLSRRRLPLLVAFPALYVGVAAVRAGEARPSAWLLIAIAVTIALAYGRYEEGTEPAAARLRLWTAAGLSVAIATAALSTRPAWAALARELATLAAMLAALRAIHRIEGDVGLASKANEAAPCQASTSRDHRTGVGVVTLAWGAAALFDGLALFGAVDGEVATQAPDGRRRRRRARDLRAGRHGPGRRRRAAPRARGAAARARLRRLCRSRPRSRGRARPLARRHDRRRRRPRRRDRRRPHRPTRACARRARARAPRPARAHARPLRRPRRRARRDRRREPRLRRQRRRAHARRRRAPRRRDLAKARGAAPPGEGHPARGPRRRPRGRARA